MSYRISYGEMPQKMPVKPRRWWYGIAVIALVLLVMARILYPAEMRQLTDALFPLTSASAQEALEVFAQNIEAGESIGDAVTAFCQEIINDANIS